MSFICCGNIWHLVLVGQPQGQAKTQSNSHVLNICPPIAWAADSVNKAAASHRLEQVMPHSIYNLFRIDSSCLWRQSLWNTVPVTGHAFLEGSAQEHSSSPNTQKQEEYCIIVCTWLPLSYLNTWSLQVCTKQIRQTAQQVAQELFWVTQRLSHSPQQRNLKSERVFWNLQRERVIHCWHLSVVCTGAPPAQESF